MRPHAPASLLGATTAAAAVGFAVPPGDTGDLGYFLHRAERLLSGEWAGTYADAALQVGPVQLLLLGALDALAGTLGISSTPLIGAVVGAGVAALFWLVARRLLGGRGGGWALLAASLAPVALGLSFDAYRDGHPAQVIAPLLWVLAGLEARAGRAWAAGALVGASAGFELWGVLGIVVFVLAPRVREGARALAGAALVVLLLYAPFAFVGEFAMFDYHWVVNGDTVLSLLIEPGTAFTWPFRVLQGAAALLAGATVAWSLRRSAAALWAGPFALVAVRLALDPVRYPWYWLAVQALVVVGVVQLAASTDLPARAAGRFAGPHPRARRAARRSSLRTS